MITPEEREKRQRFVGSSDVACIVGADPYQNAADLWLQKTGQLAEWEGNEDTRRGERLESLALDWFEERMGMPLVRDIWLDDGDCFCANLDGATLLDGETWTGRREELSSPVDAKTVAYIELWGESANDIPLPKIIQVQWQLFLIGPHAKRGYLPVIFPSYRSFGFVTPPMVKRDDELIEGLEFAAREFMEYVRSGKRPPETPHLESLKRVRREPDSVISLNEEQSLEIESYWNAGMFCERCGWFGHRSAMVSLDGPVPRGDLCPKCERACRPRSRQHYKDKEAGAKADAEQFHAKVLTMFGQSRAVRLVDGAMFTYQEQASARQTDEDLLQHRLANLQDAIARASELIKGASPGEALAVLESLDAEAIYSQVVKQGRHSVLRYKKPPKIKGARR